MPHQRPILLTLVCGYIFLVIERPWESIRYLEGLPIERIYAIVLIIAAIIHNKFRIIESPTNKWVYGLLAIHFLFAPFAYNSGFAVEQGIEYAKMVVLYLLMLSVADDEFSLKILIKAFVFSTMLYVVHSLWEYSNGHHVYRMGIARMVGVDESQSDPNSFGATVVLSIPFVYALLKSEIHKLSRICYMLYFPLAVTCVVLTGSRTSFVALLVLCGIWVLAQKGKRKWIFLCLALVASGVVWNIMPTEKQDRFRTLWDSEAGPSNAQASAEGRMVGWKASWKMFKQNPFTGVGAGGKNFVGYRQGHLLEDGAQASNQAHNVYGEVLAEFGSVGGLLFIGLILSIFTNCHHSLTQSIAANQLFTEQLSRAIMLSLVLLLVFGIGGHNFYRPLWLWLAAWSSLRKFANHAM
jgi:O-antigen ligase